MVMHGGRRGRDERKSGKVESPGERITTGVCRRFHVIRRLFNVTGNKSLQFTLHEVSF